LFHQNSKWVPKNAEFDADFNSVKKNCKKAYLKIVRGPRTFAHRSKR
jgi:hypothetical protein